MTPEKLLSILSKAAELKTTTRHCFTSEDRKELLEEMGQLNTLEAKTYKALDKLEAVISHNETEISHGCRWNMSCSSHTGRKMYSFRSI